MPRPCVALPEWAAVTGARVAHIERVSALLDRWADVFDLPPAERARWRRAAALHDALKDAPLAEQRRLADDPWGIDALLHGPAAAVMAARTGERDRGVLDAVRYHSVGYAAWDRVGRMLYLADFLEPRRGHLSAELSGLAAHVPDDPDGVLRTVVERRIAYLERRGVRPLPETLALRKSLA